MSVPAYDSYNESGVEWLGKVPSHWRITRVKDVCEILNGFPFDSKMFDPEIGQPLVRIRDLNAVEAEVRFAGTSSDRYLVTSRELLIGMDGDFNVGRWRGVEPALLNQRVCALNAPSETMSKLLEYALANPLKRINDLTYSTTVKHLSAFQVGAIRLALPPGDELPELIDFLDRETSKIDALVEAQTRLIELLKEKRQAVISHAVTKGLDPAASMNDSGVEWLGQVPAHWDIMRLKHDLSFLTSGARGWAEHYAEEGPIFLRIGNLTRDSVDLDLADIQRVSAPEGSEGERTLLLPDDVVFSITAFLGSVAVIPFDFERAFVSQHVALARPRQQRLRSRWIAYATLSSMGKAQFGLEGYGGTKVQLSLPDIANLVITAPPIHEQDHILSQLEQKLSRLDGLISEAATAIALLQERRAALISAAVTGKIDVRGLASEQAEAA